MDETILTSIYSKREF